MQYVMFILKVNVSVNMRVTLVELGFVCVIGTMISQKMRER